MRHAPKSDGRLDQPRLSRPLPDVEASGRNVRFVPLADETKLEPLRGCEKMQPIKQATGAHRPRRVLLVVCRGAA